MQLSLKRVNIGLIGIPIVLLAILAMVVLPIHPILLDVFFTFNIVLAITILLVSTSVNKPLEFSIFPTLLLVATLLRLTLNVASTRVVLLDGHLGGDAAGKVIQAFGEVVIGGNYVVGLVVFIILMIINFVVITKGGERISEVGARFTLDALPGKQMAIDADLNAGNINQEQAKQRRKEVALESDFYGSMDGASKFVRGDAIAGLLILFINIIGGISIGVFEYNMSAGDAFRTYVLLTIGDGLVAQIPSLLLATSAAIIVTRVSDDDKNMSTSMHQQLLAKPTSLYTAAGIMAILGSVPGMPHVAFYSFAGALAFVAWRQSKHRQEEDAELISQLQIDTTPDESSPLVWTDIPLIDALRLELGYRLVPLVEDKDASALIKRLRGVRKNLSEQVGFLIPEVIIRDNLTLEANEYAIYVNGEKADYAKIEPDKMMALANGQVFGEIDGIVGVDPAYGLPAIWIDADKKNDAIDLGYQVIDDATIIATHINKILKRNLGEIFHHDDVSQINDRLEEQAPKLCEALKDALTYTEQLAVFKELLSQQVPVKDIRRIASTMIKAAATTKDPILIANEIRAMLKRTIIQLVNGDREDINVYTLSNDLEQILMTALEQSRQSGTTELDNFALDPNIITQFQQNLPLVKQQLKEQGVTPVLLVPPILRPILSRYANVFADGLIVLSYTEVPETVQINIVGNLG